MFNTPDSIDRPIDRHILLNEAATLLSGIRKESFASRSRNLDFHSLFPEVPPSELLIDDFSCGNLKANVSMAEGGSFAGETVHYTKKCLFLLKDTLTIPLRVVEEIDKRNDSVSGIFPNSIIIKTDTEEHFFASFVTREMTFDLLIRLWKSISRQQTILMKTFTRGNLEDSEGDSPFFHDSIKLSSFGIVPNLENLNDSPLGMLNNREVGNHKFQKRHSDSKSDSDYIRIPGKRIGDNRRINNTRSAPEAWPTSLSRKYANPFKEFESIQMMDSRSFISKSLESLDVVPLGCIDLARELPSFKDTKENFHVITPPVINESDSLVLSTPMVLFSPISCDCNLDKSKFKVLVDHSFQTNVCNLWKILYGSVFSTEGFMRTLWEEIGYKGIQVSAWELEGASSPTKNTANENALLEDIQVGYTQNLEYMVPSTNPIGPKEIQTYVKNRVIAKESGNSTICLVQISKTPFVTSGDCFEVHLRTCLTHDGNGVSKLRVAVQVVFIKSTWIRMVIERAAVDALSTYFEKLLQSLDSHLSKLQTSVEKHLPIQKPIPTGPQTFTDHPLEKELSALKKEALKRKPAADLQIWKMLSSIDLTWLMFVAIAYLSWIIFCIKSELEHLKLEMDYLKKS